MWERRGNIWVHKEMPIITIQPLQADGGPVMINGHHLWAACCGGRPVLQIPPSTNSAEVMMQAEKYYDARIEMTTVNQPWR